MIGAPSDQPWSVGVLLLVVWRDELRRVEVRRLNVEVLGLSLMY